MGIFFIEFGLMLLSKWHEMVVKIMVEIFI